MNEQPKDRDVAIDTCCITEFKTTSISLLWPIKNFSCCSENLVRSSRFPANRNMKLKWVLDLYPNGEDADCKDYISLFIRLVDSFEETVTAEFTFYILNDKGDKIEIALSNEPDIFSKNEAIGFPHFLERKTLFDQSKGFLLDDIFKLHCKVKIIHHAVEAVLDETKSEPDESPLETLSENFGNLFQESQFSDVIFNVSQKQISAHKAILSARSPVFTAMFKHEMQESSQNEIVITDISYETMKNMLCFIYTGKVPNLETMADSMLSAADKYGLEQLKLMCENALCSNLSAENAIDTLLLADMHNANCLKSLVIDFINNNIASVKNTHGCKNILNKAPHLFMDLYFALAESKK